MKTGWMASFLAFDGVGCVIAGAARLGTRPRSSLRGEALMPPKQFRSYLAARSAGSFFCLLPPETPGLSNEGRLDCRGLRPRNDEGGVSLRRGATWWSGIRNQETEDPRLAKSAARIGMRPIRQNRGAKRRSPRWVSRASFVPRRSAIMISRRWNMGGGL